MLVRSSSGTPAEAIRITGADNGTLEGPIRVTQHTYCLRMDTARLNTIINFEGDGGTTACVSLENTSNQNTFIGGEIGTASGLDKGLVINNSTGNGFFGFTIEPLTTTTAHYSLENGALGNTCYDCRMEATGGLGGFGIDADATTWGNEWYGGTMTDGPHRDLGSNYWRLSSNKAALFARESQQNLLVNAAFQLWSGGTAVAPAEWSLTATGAGSVARESTTVLYDTYSVALTNDASGTTDIRQVVGANNNINISEFKGKRLTVGV